MSYVILIIGAATGAPTQWDGKYLRSYDPSPNGMTGAEYDGGTLTVTNKPELAERFDTIEQAAAKWKTVSPPPYNVRPDGLENRPLTAFSIIIEKYGEHT
jgi:hypothetical protein